MKDKFSLVLVTILLLLASFFLKPNTINAENINFNLNALKLNSFSDLNTTYQRVEIDGKWWIFVYDGEKLIDVYPE
jgi:hypothetical protein